MTWQLLHLADIPPTPWRNGGGVTRELVAWPNAQDWDWRISVAEVATSGPFSRFDGVQRWLAILAGAGVRLDFPSATVELTPHSAPLVFSGEDPVDCSLLDGAVQDLNLMLRDDPAQRPASVMRRVAGSFSADVDVAKTVALYNLAEPAILRVDGIGFVLPSESLVWRRLGPGARVDVEAGNALWMEW